MQNASRIIQSRSLPFERDDITRILVLVEMLCGAEVANLTFSFRFSSDADMRVDKTVRRSRVVGFRYRLVMCRNKCVMTNFFRVLSMCVFSSISARQFDELSMHLVAFVSN